MAKQSWHVWVNINGGQSIVPVEAKSAKKAREMVEAAFTGWPMFHVKRVTPADG